MANLTGRYPGSKTARQVMFSEEHDCLGWRPLWCMCDACRSRDWKSCINAEYTGGEPTWWDKEALATSRDVSSSELEAETDAAAAATVRRGDVVARTHTDSQYPEFLYYLMEVTELATELREPRKDDYNKEFAAGSVVLAGHLFEPNDGVFGPGEGLFDQEMTALMHDHELLTDPFTHQPKIVLLEPLEDEAGDRIPDGVYVDPDTHESILGVFGGHP